MALIKGIKFINLHRFVQDRLGDDAWADLCRESGLPHGPVPEAARATSWYDASAHRTLLRTLWSHYDDRSHSLLHALGRYQADCDIAGEFRWPLRMVPPKSAIEHITVYWRRTHDTGTWVSSIRPDHVEVTLSGWELLDRFESQRVLGHLGRMLEHMGGTVTDLHCNLVERSACVFRAGVTFADQPPSAGRILGDSDVFEIARELNQCDDLHVLAQTSVTLLRSLPGCRYVALFTAGRGGEVLQAQAGTRDRPECFLLETRGRIVGKLEVEVLGPSRELVGRLAPWIALALERIELSASADDGALQARLERARARWMLTPRQTQVLGHLAQGATNKEIADRLRCSEATVEIHVSHVLGKAAADNRTVLAARFWSHL